MYFWYTNFTIQYFNWSFHWFKIFFIFTSYKIFPLVQVETGEKTRNVSKQVPALSTNLRNICEKALLRKILAVLKYNLLLYVEHTTHYKLDFFIFHLNIICSKKTAQHFGKCCAFTFSYIVGFLVFVAVWEHLGYSAQTWFQNKLNS